MVGELAPVCTRDLGKVQNHTICALGKIPPQPDKLDRELFWREAIRALEHQNLPLPERSKIEAALAQKVPRGKNPHGDSDACVEWYTPTLYIEMAREVLGNIDLDPASNDLAQQSIKATQYFTIAEDGLKQSGTGGYGVIRLMVVKSTRGLKRDWMAIN
jgi:hypothetical protein